MLANVNNKASKRQLKKKYKRTEVKLVILNEEELIRQVCMRPVIYDRSLKGYRKMSLRKQCWNDISKAMDSTEEECRKRWRSLRDSFAKHYKNTQRAADTGGSKQCKWVFYDHMSFLIPHLDGVSYDFDKILDEYGDFSEDAQSLNSEPIILKDASEDLQEKEQSIDNLKVSKEHSEEHADNLQRSSTVSVQATNFMSIPIENSHQSPMHNNDNNSRIATSTVFNRRNQICDIHNSSENMMRGEINDDNNGLHFDSDEKFLLSCAPALRRLTHRQNALARLKIQQILFEIEFEQKTN